jgi:hypothetical protein
MDDMKKVFVAAALVVSGIFHACEGDANQGDKNNQAETTIATLEDSLYKAVLKLHDEAMPKMGKLIGLQKAAQSKIDSLGKLKDANSQQLLARLTQLKAQLAAAEKGMNDWMEQFNPDPDSTVTKDPAAYFADQKAKAQLMRDNIFIALDSAAAILKQ